MLELNSKEAQIRGMFGFMHMPPNFVFWQLKKHAIGIFLNLILTACTVYISLNFKSGTMTFFNF